MMNQQPLGSKLGEEVWEEFQEQQAQPQKQTVELQKQTLTLEDMKELTKLNAGYVRQIAELTVENQKTANKQFWTSIIVSIVALIIAGASLYVSIIQLHK